MSKMKNKTRKVIVETSLCLYVVGKNYVNREGIIIGIVESQSLDGKLTISLNKTKEATALWGRIQKEGTVSGAGHVQIGGQNDRPHKNDSHGHSG